MKTYSKIIFAIGFLTFIVAAMYRYNSAAHVQIGQFIRNIKETFIPFQPCSQPLVYAIGNFDSRFGISRTELTNIIEEAANVWEKSARRNLFEYATSTGDATLAVNLIYDQRQKNTDTLHVLGNDIKNDKAGYEFQKSQYQQLTATYTQKKAALTAYITSHEVRAKDYERQVEYWNEKGGAPKNEFAVLEQKKRQLNDEVKEINQLTGELNSLATTANAMAADLNARARKLNITVATFNTIGSGAGEEFNEGEYIQDENGTRINVYQFESHEKLFRLFEHELGHALGMDHVENTDAIMYRSNSSSNIELTHEDIVELGRVCKIR